VSNIIILFKHQNTFYRYHLESKLTNPRYNETREIQRDCESEEKKDREWKRIKIEKLIILFLNTKRKMICKIMKWWKRGTSRVGCIVDGSNVCSRNPRKWQLVVTLNLAQLSSFIAHNNNSQVFIQTTCIKSLFVFT